MQQIRGGVRKRRDVFLSAGDGARASRRRNDVDSHDHLWRRVNSPQNAVVARGRYPGIHIDYGGVWAALTNLTFKHMAIFGIQVIAEDHKRRRNGLHTLVKNKDALIGSLES